MKTTTSLFILLPTIVAFFATPAEAASVSLEKAAEDEELAYADPIATGAVASSTSSASLDKPAADAEELADPTAAVAVASTSSSFLKNKRELQGGSSYSSDTSSMSFMPYYGPWLDPVSNSNMLIPSSLQIAEAAQHIIPAYTSQYFICCIWTILI